MGPWKTLKTLDGITIEVRQLELTVERREWEVRSTEGRRLRVSTDGQTLKETPAGITPHGRDWKEEEIERAVLHAVALALMSPLSPSADETRQVALTSYDLYGANGRLYEDRRRQA